MTCSIFFPNWPTCSTADQMAIATVLATAEGREVFEGFETYAIALFYVLSVVAIGLFVYGFWRR